MFGEGFKKELLASALCIFVRDEISMKASEEEEKPAEKELSPAFRLDRTYGKGHTHEEAVRAQVDYWKSKTPEERLEASWYLTCIAYGIDPENPPRIDKTVGSSRKHKA